MEQGTLFDCIRPLVQSGLISSGAEFRRLVAQGGLQKNGEKARTLDEKIQTGDVLRIGKKKFVRLVIL